ncbi:S41 family peptidase [Synoicihabitans lomoniglobus]|uniref:S41 family peptidase n=1 Tax=Synoicihabitans lomoniglobus TaxID=2909285 RepID=A0AAF0A095_9BACT|nr:S41 family peptidase [Opitutaceae bacterium LMO-M01]WED64843.1 S41 family peptidase [Opitutaceae bacterium LMO-M01]
MSLCLLTGCVTPIMLGPPRVPVYANAEAKADAQIALLRQVWAQVDRRFYDANFQGADWATAVDRYREAAAAAPDTDALYDVINEMLGELNDAHTGAMTPREAWEEYTEERAYVGVNLERVCDRWVVVELRPGSAAQEAGVRAGWIAVARDGETLPEEGFSFRSEMGETYRWTFLDEANHEREVLLTARTLPTPMPPEERRAEPEGWVYLRFDEFKSENQRWLRQRLAANREAPGIVLDLRQNSGGAVYLLERIINDFFPHRVAYGAFVSRQGRRADEKSAWLPGVSYDGPLVVLIGPGSASAAEILAHVMKHYGRAQLVGRTTAGVVVSSRFRRLRDGGKLQIGMSDYQSLDGTRLEGNGVEPDVVVERTLGDLRAGVDPDLDAALAILRAGKAEASRSSVQ